MKTKKLIQKITVVLSLSGVIVALGFGCGLGFQPIGSFKNLGSTGGPIGLGTGNSGENVKIVPNVKTVALPIYTTAYNSLLSTLQVTTPSANTRAEYTRQIGSFSDSGSASTVNAPFVFAMTVLGASVCQDRIAFEQVAANPKLFFNSINLAAAPAGNVTDAALSESINRLARALWQRNETLEERTQLIADTKTIMDLDIGNNAVETREAMLTLCTTMAASTSGFTF